MAEEDPDFFNHLMDVLAEATATYLNMQIEAGVDAVQLFDSASPFCPLGRYREWSLNWIDRVIERLPEGFPVILYARETEARLEDLSGVAATVLSVDEDADLAATARALGNRPLQGNFNPELMKENPETVATTVRQQLDAMQGRAGWIVNLGHGIRPDARIESVQALVETVKRGHSF